MALCASTFLTACKPELVRRTEIIDKPVRQYVLMPERMTREVPAPAKPQPECVQKGRPTLCNKQLADWIDQWRLNLGIANDQLREIRDLEADATTTKDN